MYTTARSRCCKLKNWSNLRKVSFIFFQTSIFYLQMAICTLYWKNMKFELLIVPKAIKKLEKRNSKLKRIWNSKTQNFRSFWKSQLWKLDPSAFVSKQWEFAWLLNNSFWSCWFFQLSDVVEKQSIWPIHNGALARSFFLPLLFQSCDL